MNLISAFITDFGRLPDNPAIKELRDMKERIAVLREQVTEQIEIVYQDLEKLDAVSKERQQKMTPQERKQFLEIKKELSKYKVVQLPKMPRFKFTGGVVLLINKSFLA